MADNDREPEKYTPTIGELTRSPTYDKAATQVSKTYIFVFFVFCGVIAYLDDPSLGWWWLAVLGAGMFIASLMFAAPITYLKLSLGTKGIVSPFTIGGKATLFLIDTLGYVAMWFVTRYVIGLLTTI